ncbi:MAG: WYL domain-containing protein [Alphaproteobacteria bacterium]|nr:WYL domain-containing protein [Alphaproteobacteria bacterium]
MSRLDRLSDLEAHLRARGETTVGSLAAALGVSERTVFRDLAALRARGLVMDADPGPGGGVRLDRGLSPHAVQFTLAEVVSLWFAARLSQGASNLPWSGAARTGLAKLLGSLARPRATELHALCRRVIVGPPASEPVRAGARAPERELLGTFERAFSERRGLGFHYTDQQGRQTLRRVEPHGLLVEPPVWYVLARDLDKGEPRMFRMDRIARARLLPDIRFHPDFAVIDVQVPDRERWRPLTAA